MGKGAKAQQLANSGTAQNMSSNLYGNATNLYGSLLPMYQNEAVAPPGFTPTAKANMNTAAQQSTGGATAGSVGKGALYAARTRNAGAADASTAAGVQSAGENLSKSAVGTELADAALKESQRRQGLAGMQGLYTTDLGASQGALGLSNQALNNENNAPNFWQQYLLNAQKSAAAAAAAGA